MKSKVSIYSEDQETPGTRPSSSVSSWLIHQERNTSSKLRIKSEILKYFSIKQKYCSILEIRFLIYSTDIKRRDNKHLNNIQQVIVLVPEVKSNSIWTPHQITQQTRIARWINKSEYSNSLHYNIGTRTKLCWFFIN